MNVRRGDIVMVDFPFADQTGTKVRPALVVQSDAWNSRLDYTILAMITSSSRRRLGAATQHVLTMQSGLAQSVGLRFDSVIQCENLVTYKRSRILRYLGTLPASELAKIDDCLRATFGI